ncbi:MAG: leucine-rich repeat domain-containing protein [Huintestinicola sp.]|uniref:leucine-rich repeat domain-containing protein n=1 Tax=Huintestinicola sp. TaxID=2981661 RepID=UPI003F0F7E67
MKKRAIEAAVILAAVIALFIAFNALSGSLSDNTRRIDGQYYNTGERELSLCLMTEEGTEFLGDFDRLETLSVTPYKYAAPGAMEMGDPSYDAAIHKKAEEVYADCTDLSDLSFIAPLTGLKNLDVSHCAVSDLSFLSGMSELETLDISGTKITDLSPLLELPALTKLTADSSLSGDVTDKLAERGVTVIFEGEEETAE